MAVGVGRLRAASGKSDELVADVDEGHLRPAAPQLQLEDPAEEGQRLLDVADLDRDVVDPDEARHRKNSCTPSGEF